MYNTTKRLAASQNFAAKRDWHTVGYYLMLATGGAAGGFVIGLCALVIRAHMGA